MSTIEERTTGRFTISRDRLLTIDDQGGAADEHVARAAVANHRQRLLVVAAAPGLLKRFELWLSDDAVVAHARADDRSRPAPGVVAPRSAANSTVAALIARSIGGLPMVARPGRTSLPSVDDLLPAIVRSDGGADRAVVVGAEQPGGSIRYVICAELGGGGMMSVDVDVERRLQLQPATAPTMWAAIVGLMPDGRRDP